MKNAAKTTFDQLTLRVMLQRARVDEWEKMTGARLMSRVWCIVADEAWDKSTMTPNRFISLITNCIGIKLVRVKYILNFVYSITFASLLYVILYVISPLSYVKHCTSSFSFFFTKQCVCYSHVDYIWAGLNWVLFNVWTNTKYWNMYAFIRVLIRETTKPIEPLPLQSTAIFYTHTQTRCSTIFTAKREKRSWYCCRCRNARVATNR